ncbi:MAG: hypothetical protein J6Z07_01635 [Lachnospiraceae bacterium]|nr:hypothetical protein [Lachnospiraceae bacterium]
MRGYKTIYKGKRVGIDRIDDENYEIFSYEVGVIDEAEETLCSDGTICYSKRLNVDEVGDVFAVFDKWSYKGYPASVNLTRNENEYEVWLDKANKYGFKFSGRGEPYVKKVKKDDPDLVYLGEEIRMVPSFKDPTPILIRDNNKKYIDGKWV